MRLLKAKMLHFVKQPQQNIQNDNYFILLPTISHRAYSLLVVENVAPFSGLLGVHYSMMPLQSG
jgi:hypothetical protein